MEHPNGKFPIIPHEVVSGVKCDGCILLRPNGEFVELRCNECNAVVGTLRPEILKLIVDMITGETPCVTCPHCGYKNTFPGFDWVEIFRCKNCDAVIEPGKLRQGSNVQ